MSGHTEGRLTFRANGDANSYALIGDDGRWWMSVLMNGEQMTERQESNLRRLAACWNACAAIPTEGLESAASDPIKGMFGRLAAKAFSERDRAVRALSQLLSVLDDPRRTTEQTHDALEAARSAVATITGVQS